MINNYPINYTQLNLNQKNHIALEILKVLVPHQLIDQDLLHNARYSSDLVSYTASSGRARKGLTIFKQFDVLNMRTLDDTFDIYNKGYTQSVQDYVNRLHPEVYKYLFSFKDIIMVLPKVKTGNINYWENTNKEKNIIIPIMKQIMFHNLKGL